MQEKDIKDIEAGRAFMELSKVLELRIQVMRSLRSAYVGRKNKKRVQKT